MKIFPGKMAETMGLLEKHMAIMTRYGAPASVMRQYTPFFGGGDSVHTIIFEVDWDSLATMEAFFDKVIADSEMQALMPKWEAVEESHQVELYMSMP